MKSEKIEEEVEKLRAEIKSKGEEIALLKENIDGMKDKISGDGSGNDGGLDDILGEVSSLIDSSSSVFGVSGKSKGTEGRSSGLAGLINNLSRLAEKSESFQKKFELDGKEGVVDFHINSRPIRGSAPKTGGFHVRPAKKRAEPEKETSAQVPVRPIVEREPIYDVFEEDDIISVMVELPGTTKDDIDWNGENSVLTVKAVTPDRIFSNEIVLPVNVEWNSAETTYRNGILEITLKKANEDKPEKT